MSEEKVQLQALLVSGQMNRHHNMALMDEVLTRYLEETGRFEVTHVSSPPPGDDMSDFKPDWSAFDVVVLNYDGDHWPEATRTAFELYMKGGGGLVTVHSSDNAFPDWPAFLDMTGVGGWNGRDKSWGPAVYWGTDGMEYDHGPGEAFHPPQHEYPVTIRDSAHPVTSGLAENWLHASDELYSCLRGPAKNLRILATGFADQSLKKASGRHEPVLMALTYGEGRIFHSTLGHIAKKATEAPPSVRCVGFITTLQRGAEWAASGRVTLAIPDEFPEADRTSVRAAASRRP